MVKLSEANLINPLPSRDGRNRVRPVSSCRPRSGSIQKQKSDKISGMFA